MVNEGQVEIYEEKRLHFLLNAIKYRIKFRLYKLLTRRSSSLYLKPGDYLSWSPIIAGFHEKEVVSLLKAFADAGCRDALLDIGANIGLTTFYSRSFFDSVYCFEPNPKVFSVLTANLYDSLGKNTRLFNFGLGEREEQCVLTIPQRNYGGAFILSSSNMYTLEELASKDGFSRFDERNYDELKVDIRRGRDVLGKIFAEGKRNIVIKIDVEGFEETVLKEIAAALPADARFAIVFENWSASFDPRSFTTKFFERPVQVYKLTSTADPGSSTLRKFWDLVVHGRHYFLTDSPKNWIGTLVLADPAVEVDR
jgi:FkbM family methyltransferase